MDLEYFMKIQNAYGTKSRKERELANVNRSMARHFEDTFDTEEVLINNVPTKLMIIKDTDGNTYKKKIKSKHDDKFNLGDYVIWNNQVWLITLIDSDEKTWNRGYMYLCSVLLRWQNLNGDIVERWCYSEDFTKYSTGIESNKLLITGDYQYGLTLPVDDETKIIKRDKRFVIDLEGVEFPDVYKLTNRKILLTDDRYFSRGGILTWTLSYDAFNATTDKKITLDNGTEVWIADYIESSISQPVEPTPTGNIVSAITGRSDLKLGYKRKYNVSFTDSSGIEIPTSNVNYSWNIVSNFDDDISKTISNNTIELSVNNDSLVDESFLLQIIIDGKVNSEMTITIKGMF